MNEETLKEITRRTLFKQIGYGLGGVALSSLLATEGFAQTGIQTQALEPGVKAKAKNVIFLFMAGAPSQLDMFDYKPTLAKYSGQACPEEILKGERFAFIKGTPKLLGSPHQFSQVGQSGQ